MLAAPKQRTKGEPSVPQLMLPVPRMDIIWQTDVKMKGPLAELQGFRDEMAQILAFTKLATAVFVICLCIIRIPYGFIIINTTISIPYVLSFMLIE